MSERPEGKSMTIDKDAQQINLIVKRPETEEVAINLGRVFYNMKVKSRIYAWVLVLCMLVGICAPLLLYQFTRPMLTVSSVVTLRYNVSTDEKDGKHSDFTKAQETEELVSTLVDPKGEPLDLNTLTSASVLQKAVGGLELSAPVSLENLRSNIRMTRVMTDESSRTKEVLAGLVGANSAEAYTRLEEAKIEYQNRFIVSLTNGFGDPDSGTRMELTGEELTLVLNRILDAYNDSLVNSWADLKLPEDEISVIDIQALDLPESVEMLQTALLHLQEYCENRQDSVKSYRSSRTGLNLDDWTDSVKTLKETAADSLDAYIISQGIMRDRDAVLLTFQYRLRSLQSDLAKANETITATDKQLKSYKNDSIYVSMQESDTARSSKVTTDYYNELVLQQQEAYEEAAKLRIQIAELQNKINRLKTVEVSHDSAEAEAELNNVLAASRDLYEGIKAHMEELFKSPLYTTYSEHSAPQGELPNFLKASMRNMIIGAVAGAVIACGLWFLAALAPEFRRNRKDEEAGKEATQA